MALTHGKMPRPKLTRWRSLVPEIFALGSRTPWHVVPRWLSRIREILLTHTDAVGKGEENYLNHRRHQRACKHRHFPLWRFFLLFSFDLMDDKERPHRAVEYSSPSDISFFFSGKTKKRLKCARSHPTDARTNKSTRQIVGLSDEFSGDFSLRRATTSTKTWTNPFFFKIHFILCRTKGRLGRVSKFAN